MNYYIINDSQDYADEFSYPVVSTMTEHTRDFLLNTYEHWKGFNYDKLYFGTNEYLSFDAQEIRDYIKKASKVDGELFKKIQLFLADVSCDIVEVVLEQLVDSEVFSSTLIERASKTPFSELKILYPELFV